MILRALKLLVTAIAVGLVLPAAAHSAWNSNGNGGGYSKAYSVAGGNTPTASVSNRNVTINWTATGGNVPVAGYIVKRYSTGGVQQTIGGNCTGTVTGTSCTENAVPPGSWRYSVTPARQNWRGNESVQSTAVTVNAPALSLSPNNVTSLPQVLTGSITNYVPGQTVTFRLDNQTTGQMLTGSITPSPVPASGTASVSVTLPSGVANGSHTIYAIGSGADVSSANVTVAVSTTITTSGYDLRDRSDGTTLANASDPASFAGDGLMGPTTNWQTAFNSSRYIEGRFNAPLRPGSNLTAASFDFRFANASGSTTVGCFYIEVRRASDNVVLSTHGSSGSPLGCVTGTTQQSFSVPIGSSVTSGAIANDLKVRVIGRSSTSAGWTIDRGVVSTTGNDGSFTLYPREQTDLASGTPYSLTWSLFGDDAFVFQPVSNWNNGYDTGRYLTVTFPGYVPSGSTVNSVELTHSYRSATSGAQVCNYIQIYSGATLISSHGSTTSSLSCTTSNTTDQTDNIPLPAVDTVAEANSVTARIYMRRAATATTSQHDIARLSVTYTK